MSSIWKFGGHFADVFPVKGLHWQGGREMARCIFKIVCDQPVKIKRLRLNRSILAKTIFLYSTADTLNIQLYMYFEH